MKTARRYRIWLWLAGLFVLLGAAVWLFMIRPRQAAADTLTDYWPGEDWRTAVPEEQGFRSASLAKGLQELQEENIAIDSLLIIRDGYLVLEAFFSPYDGTFPHDLGSVAKSVMTTLIGIAADQEKLQLDQPMMSFFPDRAIANMDARKERITVRHLIGMVNGMESGCFEGDEPTLDAMRSNPDWVQAALDREMMHEPGGKFCYDSPGMHILSAILQESTGMTTAEFARLYLFEPLGIHDFVWESDSQGYTHGWGDLHLKPGDAARLGYLWLKHGFWDGTQVVPESWVRESVQAKSKLVGAEFGYGYGWWVSPVDYYATGREGQFVRAIPSLNTVVVTTGGGFDFSQLESFLIPLLLDSNRKLPANPAGVAQLNATLADLLQEPAPQHVVSPPDASLSAAGETYACQPNAAGVETLRLEFTGAEIANLYLRQFDKDVVWPIGLDGNYRLSLGGQAQRGHWEDPYTFIIEVFDIGLLTRRFHFGDDNLEVMIPELPLTLECRVQKP